MWGGFAAAGIWPFISYTGEVSAHHSLLEKRHCVCVYVSGIGVFIVQDSCVALPQIVLSLLLDHAFAKMEFHI